MPKTPDEIPEATIDAGTSATKYTVSGRRADYIARSAQQKPLTGFSSGPDTAVVASDSVFTALRKLQGQVNQRQPRETGKGLSTNDFTTAEKNKLAGLSNTPSQSIHMNCVLVADGFSRQVRLLPKHGGGGCGITINGVVRPLPEIGVVASLPNTGTWYNIYAQWTGSAVVLTYSGAAPTWDPYLRLWTQTGDAEQTFVGVAIGNLVDARRPDGIRSAYNGGTVLFTTEASGPVSTTYGTGSVLLTQGFPLVLPGDTLAIEGTATAFASASGGSGLTLFLDGVFAREAPQFLWATGGRANNLTISYSLQRPETVASGFVAVRLDLSRGGTPLSGNLEGYYGRVTTRLIPTL